ncbi:MAG: hypothetical protein L0229_09575 [Blastocatellia bacterium]|nr:hypothetical protein [Blastocatellia bacterium]
MSELFVMRRANGDLFAEQMHGRVRIPVWPSAEAVARYKARNPELMIFWPVRLDRSLMKQIKAGFGKEGRTELFLLSEDAPDAHLDDGKPVAIEEIFPEVEPISQPAGAQV